MKGCICIDAAEMKNQAEDSMPSYSYLRLDADDQLTVLPRVVPRRTTVLPVERPLKKALRPVTPSRPLDPPSEIDDVSMDAPSRTTIGSAADVINLCPKGVDLGLLRSTSSVKMAIQPQRWSPTRRSARRRRFPWP